MDESVNVTNEVKVKNHYTGKVVKTSLAGALVDIGTGTPAYLHVSQVVPADPSQPIKTAGRCHSERARSRSLGETYPRRTSGIDHGQTA